MNAADTMLDLSNCDREPIHIPGSIQPHGVLLAFAPDTRLAACSANAAMLGCALPAQGGMLNDAHLEPKLRAAVLLALQNEAHHEDLFGIALPGGRFDVIFSKSDGLTLVEFEQYRDAGMSLDTFPLLTQRALERIQRQQNIDDLLVVTVQEIHALTGFDRVMAYRFLPDDSGEVVAERKRSDLESFLGQRYPAGDIPAQARRLFVLNPLRLIVDVGYTPVPLLPDINPLTGASIDLSHSVLRSVSPVHVEYLSNMGVAASMSISIVVNGRLWGMAACHHTSPYMVPRAVRMSCQLLSQVLSVLVERTQSHDQIRAIEYSSATRTLITERAMQSGDMLQSLTEKHPRFTELISCDGGAISIDGDVVALERSPSSDAVARLIGWLDENNVPDVFCTDSLLRDAPGLQAESGRFPGLLAVRFHRERAGYALWFREEQIEKVRWAGNPEKVYTTGPLGPRLTPRGSFAEWQQEVKGKSNAWLQSEIEIATRFRTDMQEIALAKSTLSERARDTLFAMLGHDLRDPLQAIMMAAQVLEKQNQEDQPGANLGRRIVTSSARMKRLISQVLDVSRIQKGAGLEITPVPTDVCALLHDLVRETTTAHPGLQLALDCRIEGTVRVDPDRVTQAVSNLLSNARHHGAADKPVHVHAAHEPDMLLISVTNHGKAIDAARLPGLFNPFKFSAQRNTRNPTGLGLGLYIVNEIVKGHGGTIDVHSAEDKVRFEIRLPG
ncbi:MAG TPA: ATP-binding protein [Oxalicibacterium sp.]|nr:ATP-binding protein [Oxalicibacterium sp.]